MIFVSQYQQGVFNSAPKLAVKNTIVDITETKRNKLNERKEKKVKQTGEGI
jgi:hypothetical protein